jgi:adenylyltransferase/sulfurtransferase
LIGLVQATEAIKLILGVGEPLVGRLLLVDALGMRFRELKLRRDPECPVCGERPSIGQLIDYQEFCGVARKQPATSAVPEISVEELKAKMDAREPFVLVDVREPHEYQICRIEGARLIPLRQLSQRLRELERDADIVVHCKSGIRSAKAVESLAKAGFQNVKNLAGGIIAWSDKIDPSVPKY